jgi:hypothetical protein
MNGYPFSILLWRGDGDGFGSGVQDHPNEIIGVWDGNVTRTLVVIASRVANVLLSRDPYLEYVIVVWLGKPVGQFGHCWLIWVLYSILISPNAATSLIRF